MSEVMGGPQPVCTVCTVCTWCAQCAPGVHRPGFLQHLWMTPDKCMQRKGVPMLYELAATQVPKLYVWAVENDLSCLWFSATWTARPSIQLRAHTDLGFQGKLLLIWGPTVGQEAGFIWDLVRLDLFRFLQKGKRYLQISTDIYSCLGIFWCLSIKDI
jgi:hypothetical protein